jgi:hypothetical protein
MILFFKHLHGTQVPSHFFLSFLCNVKVARERRAYLLLSHWAVVLRQSA